MGSSPSRGPSSDPCSPSCSWWHRLSPPGQAPRHVAKSRPSDLCRPQIHPKGPSSSAFLVVPLPPFLGGWQTEKHCLEEINIVGWRRTCCIYSKSISYKFSKCLLWVGPPPRPSGGIRVESAPAGPWRSSRALGEGQWRQVLIIPI